MKTGSRIVYPQAPKSVVQRCQKLLRRDKLLHTPKKFDPKHPVSIYNPYPRSKWPIKYGKLVWAEKSQGGTMGITEGFVIWFHPARNLDASSVTSPGQPFYTIQILSKMDDGQYVCARREVFGKECVFPHTDLGFKQCAAIIVKAALESVEYCENQLTLTRNYRRQMLEWFSKIKPGNWNPFDAIKNKTQKGSRHALKSGAKGRRVAQD